MNYDIQFETRARKEFLALPGEIIERLLLVIDDLAENPRPMGAKKLSGVDGYRIRKGDYRVLYSIDDAKKTVFVFRVGHRKDIYRRK